MSHVWCSPCKAQTVNSMTSAAPIENRFFRSRLRQFPNSTDGYNRRANYYVTKGQEDQSWFDKAVADFNKALKVAQKKDDVYVLRVRGSGHGAGFSQFGGNEMAKGGSSAEEILKKYFPAMKLENL